METARAYDETESMALRIGIVEQGRIVEEHIMRRRRPVTVGSAPGNRIMVTSPEAPESMKLLSLSRGRYVLRFRKGQRGKVTVRGEVLDLKTIAQRRLAGRRKDEFSFPLSDQSRGKIVLGESTLLFQFVTPPAPVPRYQVPLEARRASWRNLDKTLFSAVLLAAIFLGGSGFSLETWWRHSGRYLATSKTEKTTLLQTLYDARVRNKPDPVPVAQTGQTRPDPNVITDPKIDPEPTDPKDVPLPGTLIIDSEPEDNGTTAVADAGDFDIPNGHDPVDLDMTDVRRRVEDGFSTPKTADAGTKDLKDFHRMGPNKPVTLVDVMGGDWGVGEGLFPDTTGGGVRKLKDRQDFAEGEWRTAGGQDGFDDDDGLADAASDIKGTWSSPVKEKEVGSLLPPAAAGLDPNSDPLSLDSIKSPSRKLDEKKKKKEETEFVLDGVRKGRRDENKTGGHNATINEFIRGRSSILRRCYVKAARNRPEIGGKLVLKIYVALNGKISVKVVKNETGDAGLAKCVVAKLNRWKFPKPKGKTAIVKIPLLFRAQ